MKTPSDASYLRAYRRARDAMRDIVDLPEMHANLFLRLCFASGCRLTGADRNLPAIALLTDAEITRLEDAVATAYGDQLPESRTVTAGQT